MPDLAPLLTPDRHELVELVRDLHSQASPWIPSGLGNHLHWGPQPQIQSSVLSLRRHNQVLEHATGDFTVTVEAGMPLNELQAVLAERGQWLPIDPPLAGPSSIGGVVARGVSGPLRHKAMGLKDQVIGISLLRSDGTTAQAGGQVVKNVAGYDLMRLLTGSWGSLALITQLTLRTQPLPSSATGSSQTPVRPLPRCVAPVQPCLPCSSCAKSFCSIAPWPWSGWNGCIKPARSGCGCRWSASTRRGCSSSKSSSRLHWPRNSTCRHWTGNPAPTTQETSSAQTLNAAGR